MWTHWNDKGNNTRSNYAANHEINKKHAETGDLRHRGEIWDIWEICKQEAIIARPPGANLGPVESPHHNCGTISTGLKRSGALHRPTGMAGKANIFICASTRINTDWGWLVPSGNNLANDNNPNGKSCAKVYDQIINRRSGLPVLRSFVPISRIEISGTKLDSVEVMGLNIWNFPTADTIRGNTSSID